MAEQKDDQPFLLQIRDKVNRYRSEVSQNMLRKAPLDMMSTKLHSHIVGFVDEKVFDDMDIMKMTELRDTYFDMLEQADIDAQNYCT